MLFQMLLYLIESVLVVSVLLLWILLIIYFHFMYIVEHYFQGEEMLGA